MVMDLQSCVGSGPEGEVHSVWDLWISGLHKCKGNGFFEVGWGGQKFQSGPENLDFFLGAAPARTYLPEKLVGGGLTFPVSPPHLRWEIERSHVGELGNMNGDR